MLLLSANFNSRMHSNLWSALPHKHTHAHTSNSCTLSIPNWCEEFNLNWLLMYNIGLRWNIIAANNIESFEFSPNCLFAFLEAMFPEKCSYIVNRVWSWIIWINRNWLVAGPVWAMQIYYWNNNNVNRTKLYAIISSLEAIPKSKALNVSEWMCTQNWGKFK